MRIATRLKSIVNKLRLSPPNPEDERTFLSYQKELREGGTHVLNEAMLVLDIIDAKTQSLLSYISISLAAMVFLITSLPKSVNLNFLFFGETILTASLLLVILALLAASILCLSCLNIVGAHTIRLLKYQHCEGQQEYEDLIVRVTLGRRNRYIIAHRISILTAFFIVVLFTFLFLGSMAAILKL